MGAIPHTPGPAALYQLVSVYMLQSTCTSITVLQYVCVVGWWMLVLEVA